MAAHSAPRSTYSTPASSSIFAWLSLSASRHLGHSVFSQSAIRLRHARCESASPFQRSRLTRTLMFALKKPGPWRYLVNLCHPKSTTPQSGQP